MFTGIVQGVCDVVSVEDLTNLRRIGIELGDLGKGLATGASVAVNGCCLTATAVDHGRARFDVIRETLDLTNLGVLMPGSRVNVERSFRVGDEIGGHILSGHIADCARVTAVDAGENRVDVTLAVAARWMKYLHHKGFVALDGASLTLAAVDRTAGTIRVSLIPETLARTRFGAIRVGDAVNLEIDAQTQSVVDTVERVLSEPDWRERVGA